MNSRLAIVASLTFLVVMVITCYNSRMFELQTGFVPLPPQMHEKLKCDTNFQNLYSVSQPTHQTVAWVPVILHIRPRQATDLLVGKTAFRGEATNINEMIVLDIKHTGKDKYTATFLPSFEGKYTIKLVITFVNREQFNYPSHVNARMVHICGSPFHLTVKSRAPPEGITRYCSQSESGTARGRWVRCGSFKDIEKCGPWQFNKKYNFDKIHDFFWLPYKCQLHHYTDIEMKTCLVQNGWENIFFSGDSHSRYRTCHWITRLYGKCENCSMISSKSKYNLVPKLEWIFDSRGTRWATTFPSIIRPKEIYIDPKKRRSMFSLPLPKEANNGGLYLMNFGHWLLREGIKLKRFLAHKVRAHLEAVKLMNVSKIVNSGREKQKRFLWVNTLSLMWRPDYRIQCPTVVAYMNNIVDTAMKNAGIQIVDAFQVSNVRLGAAFDKVHFAKLFPDESCGGVVENAVTNLILNALCNV